MTGRNTKGPDNGTSWQKWDGWQPYITHVDTDSMLKLVKN